MNLTKEINLLFEIIYNITSVTKEEIVSKSRKIEIVDARRIFSFIIKKNFDVSLREIGQILGGRDHATIISSIKKHSELFESNKNYIEKYEKIYSKFLVSRFNSGEVSLSVRELKSKKDKILNEIDKEMAIAKKVTIKKRNKSIKVGLFLGSFNPIHNMHLTIANNIKNNYDIDEVWFLFSDENYEIKNKEKDLLSLKNRIKLLKAAIIDNPYFKLAKIDYSDDTINLVSDSLKKITSKYKDYNFSLIMGADYLYNIEQIKDNKNIKKDYKIFYYERGGAHMKGINDIIRDEYRYSEVVKVEGILETNISSTKIRNILKEENGIDKLKYIMPDNCLYIIEQNNFYINN